MFSYLWQWFIVATFGLSPITVIQAIGLSIVVNFIVLKLPKIDDEYKPTIEDVFMSEIRSISIHGFIFVIGFVFSLFM